VIHVGRYHDDLHPLRALTFSHRRPARFDVRHPNADPRTGRPCSQRIASARVIPPDATRALTWHFRRPLHLCTQGARVTPVGRRY
jgi:hypothetical protein